MYAQPTGSITSALHRLREHIAYVPQRLTNLSETELTQKAPGKWSCKEILGHLIDSALNNLKRFTDAQVVDGAYFIQGYDQNKLVVINQYQNVPVAHLLTLWSSLNTQIAYVVEAIPNKALSIPIRFEQANQPSSENSHHTLSWLIDDYVAHLEHHLKTLL